MPTFLHGKNTRVLFSNPALNSSYDLSQFFNDVSVSTSIEAQETTTFQTGGVKSYITGLKDGAISLAGLYDGTSTGVDQIFTDAINNDGNDAVLVFPNGAVLDNEVCYMANGIETKYDLKSPVTGVVSVDAEVQATNGVRRGRGKYFTTTANGSSVAINNASATTNGGFLIIGVLSLTGTLSLTFQHGSNGSVYVDMTTPLTAVGTQVYTTAMLPASMLQYTRLHWTLSGVSPSATIFYGFSRF
jgi:hypothetical protein